MSLPNFLKVKLGPRCPRALPDVHGSPLTSMPCALSSNHAGDRIKSIMFLLRIAVYSKRVLLVRHSQPFPLEKVRGLCHTTPCHASASLRGLNVLHASICQESSAAS